MSERVGKKADNAVRELAVDVAGEEQGLRRSLSIPWHRLSDLLGGGLRPGEVTILAGGVGSAKSYLSLCLCLHCYRKNVLFSLLPCEDTASDAMRRFWALLENDWGLLKTDQDGAEKRGESLARSTRALDEIRECVCENPRTPEDDLYGGKFMPMLPWDSVTKWLRTASKESKFIVCDPITMFDFGCERVPEWQGQQDFIREAVTFARTGNAHILLVCHLAKRSGRSEMPPTLDDVQGSTGFVRFAHNVLLLAGHEERESEVMRYGDGRETVTHKRTLTIGKTRNGPGTGLRLAFDFKERGPVLSELGIIAPKT